MKTTVDGLLNRRVALEQPTEGYRVAVDTVLLAGGIPAKAGDRIIDLGCGSGGVMLCLMRRVPAIFMTGVEIQPELAALCKKNIKSNGFEEYANAVQEDVTHLPESYPNSFDHVAINPPYHDERQHDVSSHSGKRTANSEKPGDLTKWIEAAAKILKTSGSLTLIHRADRLDDILRCTTNHFGHIDVLPILPKTGTSAKRVIVRAIKGAPNATYFCQSLILHKDDNGYTDETEAILRHMEPLIFKRI